MGLLCMVRGLGAIRLGRASNKACGKTAAENNAHSPSLWGVMFLIKKWRDNNFVLAFSSEIWYTMRIFSKDSLKNRIGQYRKARET